MTTSFMQNKKPEYKLNENGQFVIENYNQAKAFSSFYPGIAGKNGIPLWLFYVNRGQCVCSMGVQDKENPIMEFLPANWAYQLVTTQGFRTFLKFTDNRETAFYEPFQDHLRDAGLQRRQRMEISGSHLVLVDENETLGLRTTVSYHGVPQDSYAGLIRKLRIENTGPDSICFEGLDGLALIIPYGISNGMLKHIRRLTEAFVEVINHEQRAPMFKAKVEPADRPDVVRLSKGNFYLGLEHGTDGLNLLEPIVDPQRIFGTHLDYAFPSVFLSSGMDQLTSEQILENRLPAAMSPFKTKLAPGESYTLSSIIGHVESSAILNQMLPRITTEVYHTDKTREYENLIDELTRHNLVHSSEPAFDHYVRQNFLDNVMRGGYPYTLHGEEGQSVLHLYSRKHGDLERDYNDYRVTPSPYSQGNGNYRDINQNRRSDLLFNPDVGADNVKHFYNLVQLDGFNPLVIKELRFVLKNDNGQAQILDRYFDKQRARQVEAFMSVPRTPGELLLKLRADNIKIQGDNDCLLGDLLAVCTRHYDTDHTEGYWSDHWAYNLDLLENYLSLYPEKRADILFHQADFTFHDSPYRVRPRDDKYVIWEDKLMQLDSVYLDEEKAEFINARKTDHDLVRTSNGEGPIFRTTLLVKMLSILVNKMASLDPSGIGVEMETDKPNWYDALNGLPGLMGSSLSETLEIKRHISFLLDAINTHLEDSVEIPVFEELNTFINALWPLVKDADSSFEYWDAATSLKEIFREQTRLGISGIEARVTTSNLVAFLNDCLERLDQGIQCAWDSDGKIPSTYFRHNVTAHEILKIQNDNGDMVTRTNAKGQACFKALSFEILHLPYFLEGPVHYLRNRPPMNQAQKLVENIRNSDLFDTKLRMYKVNASLAEQIPEIGRAHTFSPGWFENESVWLHMEYKYMLEILRNGLFEEFYQDFRNVFIPFHNPETYGRSILENSSFIVSSANPDPGIHGTGYVARLSGATAEFIQILALMTLGQEPFKLNPEGKLTFSLNPALPGWLFSKETKQIELAGNRDSVTCPAHTFCLMFLGSILVRYHNPEHGDTFGSQAVVPARWIIMDKEGNVHEFEGERLQGKIVQDIRERKVVTIDVHLEAR